MELWTCPKCGTETPQPIEASTYLKRKSLLDLAKFADTTPFYRYVDKHALILGAYEAGKSTLQYWMMGFFFSNAFHHESYICRSQYGKGYLTIFRALPNTFEYLAICDAAPLQLFIPTGCVYKYEHPNLSIVEFDFEKRHQILDKLRRDKINVIGVDHFLTEPDQVHEWWGRFIFELLHWKIQPEYIRVPMLFCFDEIGDLVPNRGETESDVHLKWGNRIRHQFDGFRRSNIKIIATTHSITDLKKRFRNNFPYWFIKRTTAESVPDRYEDYGLGIIEKLENDEVFVKDRLGRYQRKPSPAWVLTEKIGVYTEPSKELEEKLQRSEVTYAWRLRMALEYMKLQRFTYEARALATGYAKSNVYDFEQRYPLDKCPLPLLFDPNAEDFASRYPMRLRSPAGSNLTQASKPRYKIIHTEKGPERVPVEAEGKKSS